MPNLVKRQPLDVYAHLNDVANQAAILLNIDEAILTDWFNRQVGWWMAHARKLSAAKPSPLNAARLAHATETIALLRKRGHVLACRRHGVQGIDGEDWDAARPEGTDPRPITELYIALANRGIFDLPEGGDYGEWERDCETCLQGVLRGGRVDTPPEPATLSESPPVKPQGTLRCSHCRAMTDAVARGLTDALCASCFKAWRPRR